MQADLEAENSRLKSTIANLRRVTYLNRIRISRVNFTTNLLFKSHNRIPPPPSRRTSEFVSPAPAAASSTPDTKRAEARSCGRFAPSPGAGERWLADLICLPSLKHSRSRTPCSVGGCQAEVFSAEGMHSAAHAHHPPSCYHPANFTASIGIINYPMRAADSDCCCR